MSLPAISRHLRVLEKPHPIERQRHGRLHLIRTDPDGFDAAQKWIAQYAMAWDARFDALDDLPKQ